MHDEWVMVESSDKTWFTGEGNGKPLQYSWLKNPMNNKKKKKGKKIWHCKMNSPGWQLPNMLLEKGVEIAPERMKRLSQSKNTAQSLMWLVMEVNSDTEKNNIA